MRKYGINIEQFNSLLQEFDFSCFICSSIINPEETCVDHDHEKGVIRGLLCQKCNKAIGNLKDDPAIVRKAADYLENPPLLSRFAKVPNHPVVVN